MRYIIIPLLIILYGWWTFRSIKQLIDNFDYPDDATAIYAIIHSFIALCLIVFYGIKFCWENW